MKINGFKPAGDLIKAYNRQKTEQAGSKQAAGTAGATLQLSAAARFKKEIETALQNLPEIREDLVNRLRTEIQAGTYRPAADKIAEGILKERLLDKLV
ncbi:flagellar biosynthesis anti-sigma factor FlgM [Desulforamulus hydrothermalis]|uniref:Negative regulator of flagellin synthesis n=1 Tax=Desulforamulus hydrothermalis Lam5 = DSM 18033 TaxID=1121428 RepID=K8E0S4_9FIRM|nr:flagellar biosynthesis anti-sigma factor FlgM [Desulforamulus hydrothermalis]CCO09140.1 putative anti-sigma-28 factor, FlgM [Desulforamulus hydrothermalis Lam5 = DSM 18033]SHH11815.1 anti-sigma-28 factor, FlgM family [Desulforamulus hydrothermalis Lam5 = DSM 18033]